MEGNRNGIIVVLGSCGLDRQLVVETYPQADSKVRTTQYIECGGGNAANTAVTLATLQSATMLPNYSVKLITKLGDDGIGRMCLKDLQESGVDTEYCLVQPQSTTGICHVIVSQQQDHPTRTCLYTPGTCGTVRVSELDAFSWDNVVHIHSDSRCPEATLHLFQRAKDRHIFTSIYTEKDRSNAVLDRSLEFCDVIFTNSAERVYGYWQRLMKDYAVSDARFQEVPPRVESDNDTATNVEVEKFGIHPCWYFFKRFGTHPKITVTLGNRGSVSIQLVRVGNENDEDSSTPTGAVRCTVIDSERRSTYEFTRSLYFDIERCGSLIDAHVVDTTGAGDTFIGAYIAYPREQHNPLRFSNWVAGTALRKVGARNGIPTGHEIDANLGRTLEDVELNLQTRVGQK